MNVEWNVNIPFEKIYMSKFVVDFRPDLPFYIRT